MAEVFEVAGAIIASVSVAGGLLFGMSNWLGQVWLNRIMARERAKIDRTAAAAEHEFQKTLAEFQSTLGSRSFAFTKQYEKEFAVYELLWRQVVELYSATVSLRPNLDSFDRTEDPDLRKERRLKRYYDAMQEVRDTILNNKPFYHRGVYDQAQELSSLCQAESLQYELRDPAEQGHEYWEHSSANREKVIAQSDVLCEAIRERISAVEMQNAVGAAGA